MFMRSNDVYEVNEFQASKRMLRASWQQRSNLGCLGCDHRLGEGNLPAGSCDRLESKIRMKGHVNAKLVPDEHLQLLAGHCMHVCPRVRCRPSHRGEGLRTAGYEAMRQLA